MSRGFYWKMAASNLRKNSRVYLPYLLTCVLTAAMYYIICSLAGNSGLAELQRGRDVAMTTLNMGIWITGIFAVIFLFYTSSFLMKRRKKEFGLFNILGMEKKHLAKVIFCETFYVAVITLAVGLAVGVLLDKLIFLALLKLLKTEVSLGFQVNIKAIGQTGLLLCLVFLAVYLNSLFQVHLSKPIELLRGGNTGEKEPKGKWILALLGAICLGSGYYLAVITKNPVAALSVFFVAVILVIIGTYLLFMAGSIVFLKVLRKNKNYYYKTKHFISVSSMIFRMKQNAVGLANICILSTMVLVMLTTTVSLYLGIDKTVSGGYPRDIIVSSSNISEEGREAVLQYTDQMIAQMGLSKENVLDYVYTSFEVIRKEGGFYLDQHYDMSQVNLDHVSELLVISLEDWNRVTGQNQTLEENQVLLYPGSEKWTGSNVKVQDMDFQVKEVLDEFPDNGNMVKNILNTFCLVVRDQDLLLEFQELQKTYYDYYTRPQHYYGFNIDADEETEIALRDLIAENPGKPEGLYSVGSRAGGIESGYTLHGGLLFIGIFLGSLFLMATILIIYYKQISEGYEDQGRFEILQKVGMTQKEIRNCIHSQILTVFYLPLVTAALHMMFAFPVISRIMRTAGFTDTKLYLVCTLACLLVFAVLYAMVYSLTARAYYKIVRD